MKKIFCLISIFVLFLTLPVFAEYKPIPKELSKQYKAEMEQIMYDEYPNIVESIDNYFIEGKKDYENIMKKGFDSDKFGNLQSIAYSSLGSYEAYLYFKLMQITQEKFLKLNFEPFPTDEIAPYYEYLLPYFSDNNVNINLLNTIAKYRNKKYLKLERYITIINKKYL